MKYQYFASTQGAQPIDISQLDFTELLIVFSAAVSYTLCTEIVIPEAIIHDGAVRYFSTGDGTCMFRAAVTTNNVVINTALHNGSNVIDSTKISIFYK
jgi:hypothetical protein